MRWLCLSVGLVMMFVSLLFLRKNDKDEKSVLLKMPKSFFYLSFFCALLWAGLVIEGAIILYEPTIPFLVLMLACGFWWLISFTIMMSQKNWSIRFYEDRFVHTNFLGIKRQFFYRDIKYIKQLKIWGETIKINKKIFPLIIAPYVENCNSFIDSYNAYLLSQRESK